MIPRILVYSTLLLAGCGSRLEQQATTDSTSIDSTIAFTTEAPANLPQTDTDTKLKNFYGLLTYPLTEDERESKILEALQSVIDQYDTTAFNTISKSYTMPGTEETPDETLNTATTVTITLFYNDAEELKAVWREYSYEIGGPDRFEKTNSLYLFDTDLIAVYEDSDVSIDMAYQRYTRGVAKNCPECGITMSAGISSGEVTVSGGLTEADFAELERVARTEESFLAYVSADSFQSNGFEYIYQTAEPLNEDADYDVFYTANKGYYEKFLKPKLGN